MSTVLTDAWHRILRGNSPHWIPRSSCCWDGRKIRLHSHHFNNVLFDLTKQRDGRRTIHSFVPLRTMQSPSPALPLRCFKNLDAWRATRYITRMITAFKHKGLKRFYETGSTAGIQPTHRNRLRLQLAALDTAVSIEDMNVPGFNLHPLKGRRKGIWSISVSGNWRITFRFENGSAHIVDYEDYH